MTKAEKKAEKNEKIESISLFDKTEKQAIIDFLSNPNKANMPSAMVEFASQDDSLLKNVYDTEKTKYEKRLSCKIADENAKLEDELKQVSLNFINSNMADISEYMASNIGNKQSQTLIFTEKLADGRRVDRVITGIRKVLLTADKIQKPMDLINGIKTNMWLKTRKVVDLITVQKRSLSLLKKDDMPSDDLLRYGVNFKVREATKKEISFDESADLARKKAIADEEKQFGK